MDFGLPDEVLPKVIAVLSSNPKVKQITLYGSRAMGSQRQGSDIDLCLDVEGLTLSEMFALEQAIDDLLLPWKVDISIKQKIENAALLDHIQRVGLKVFDAGTAT